MTDSRTTLDAAPAPDHHTAEPPRPAQPLEQAVAAVTRPVGRAVAGRALMAGRA